MNATQKEIDVVSEVTGLVPLLDADLEVVGGGSGPVGDTAPKTGSGGTG